MIVLRSGCVTAEIEEMGAEIKSLKLDAEEFMWNKKDFWPKTSPVLFPFVGGLREGKYIYEGVEYSMPTRHGFARDNKFEVVYLTDDEVTFKFSSTEETLKKYPFKFELYMKYTLTGKGFNLSYLVKNIDDKDMYFSIGAHPAFLLEENYENVNYIEFEKEESASKYRLHESGFYDGLKEFFSKQENKKVIEILDNNFEEDAISFKGLNSNKVFIKSRNNDKEVMVDFTGFPYVAFWKPLKAPFVCIEPWFGINDNINQGRDIKEKEGIQKLESNSEFNAILKFEFKKGN